MTELSKRVKPVSMFLDSLPNINEYRFKYNGKHYLSTYWLCGAFAERCFVDCTANGALIQLMSYFDQHVNHKSIVGDAVTKSGWPDLDKVKNYLHEKDNANNG